MKFINANSIIILLNLLYLIINIIGAKKEKLRLKNADDIDNKDEINLYLRARMLPSMDAMWRVMVYLFKL